MRRVLFLFLDGVGLGPDDPEWNPLARNDYPTLGGLLGGRRLVAETGRYVHAHAQLIPLDAQMGVPGRPQSATGQAALLTGLNAPALVGEHYGPRPDDRVRAVVDRGNLLAELKDAQRPAYFCNAYPKPYFDAVNRGKRLLSVLPYAATQAGQTLLSADDFRAGQALAADFTGAGWHEQLGYVDTPVLDAAQAGAALWKLAQPYAFVLFEHWLTDLLGHRQRLVAAVDNFRQFDGFLGGLLEAIGAQQDETLVLVVSDHGNVEDCSHGKHTENPALGLVIGGGAAAQHLTESLHDLSGVAAVVRRFLGVTE